MLTGSTVKSSERGLEWSTGPGFFCAVTFHTVRPGTITQVVVAGALAAAATAGALLGFGIQQGTPARPFNAVASLVIGDQATGLWGFHPMITSVGVLVQVTAAFGWALLFARFAGGMRGPRLGGAAVLVAGVALAVHTFLFGQLGGPGVGEALVPAQVVALHLVLGITLVVGIRFAPSLESQ